MTAVTQGGPENGVVKSAQDRADHAAKVSAVVKAGDATTRRTKIRNTLVDPNSSPALLGGKGPVLC